MVGQSRTTRLAVFLTVVVPASCVGGGLTDVQLSGPPPEVDLPTAVGQPNFGTEMLPFQPAVQWSADGRTIYYSPAFGPPFGVLALDVQTGQTRVVVTAENTSFSVLRLSGDGAFLFYASQRNQASDGASIYRLPLAGGDPEPLVEGARPLFAISRDGGMLAWRSHTADSLFVRDLRTGNTRHIPGERYHPLAISPDHGTLLLGGSIGEVFSHTLSTGVTSEVAGIVNAHDVRWGAHGVEVLGAGFNRVEVVRGTDAPVALWTAPSDEFYAVYGLTWSPDGTHIAASLTALCFYSKCQSKLLLINVSTGSATVVAKAGDIIGKTSFSADGRHLALTTGGRLHVWTRP